MRLTSKPAARAPHAQLTDSGRLLAFQQPARDEAELVRGLIEREPSAIAQLFDNYRDVTRRSLIRLLGNDDVDDLVQQTFLVVLDKCAELRKPQALRSFVVSVAMRLAKNELRKRRLRAWIRLGDEEAVPLKDTADSACVEQVEAVYRALDRLDAESRVLFVMRHVEGWELAELADGQGCSLATLKRRLQRAEARFRAIAAGDPALRAFVEVSS